MISFTQNLYRVQWLDLVFKNRNQAFGAYELRKNNAETTVKAFFYGAAFFSSLIITPWLIHQISKTNTATENNEQIKIIEVNLLARIKELKPEKKPITKAPSKPVQAKGLQYANLNVVPKNQTESDIPTQEQLHEAVITTRNIDGEASLNLNPIEIQEETSGITGISASAENMELYALDGIENYPEWKPGIQNKQKVRVAYTLPINFSLP